MTEQEILRQMEELQAKLNEIRAERASLSVIASMTEAEKEKQHQEDLQRLRGLRLIDDDFRTPALTVSRMVLSFCSGSSWISRISA